MDHLAEKPVRCPWCSMRLFVPKGPKGPVKASPSKKQPPPQAENAARGAFRVCPFCAERVRAQAVKCRYCGEQMPSTPKDGLKEGTISLWDALTEGELAVIEEGRKASSESPETGRRRAAGRSPAEKRSRRRVKRFLRELARLVKWARVSEFKEVRQAVKRVRQELMERFHAVLVEAKKDGAIEETVTWDGEVRYRFTGEENTWSVPVDQR